MFRDHQSRPPYSTASDVLAGRLRTGERLIDSESDPNRRAELERHWLDLLKRYEAAVDAERDAVSQVPFVMGDAHQEGAPA